MQGAATAVSGAYVGVLGLTYAVAQNKILPIRGMIPTLFFGLAIFLAAVYVSFVTRPKDVPGLPTDGSLYDKQLQRRNTFVVWVSDATFRRRKFLQASVISLGIGAILLPLPFVNICNTVALVLAIAGLLVVLGLPYGISRWIEKG